MADIGEEIQVIPDAGFDRSECYKYCQLIQEGTKKAWKCTICLQCNFKYKCLVEYHILAVHLHNKGCTWCNKTFETIDEIKDHCRQCQCRAGGIKRLNEKLVSRAVETMENDNNQDSDDKVVESTETNTQSNRNASQDVNKSKEIDQLLPELKQPDEFTCPKCGQKFFSKQQVYWHQIRRGCGLQQKQKVKERQDITEWYSLVTDEADNQWNMYQCLKCKTCYPNQFAVKRHIRRRHWKQKNYSCPVCKKAFFDLTAWKYHTKSPLGCRNVTVAMKEALKTDFVADNEEEAEKQDKISKHATPKKEKNGQELRDEDNEESSNISTATPRLDSSLSDQNNSKGVMALKECSEQSMPEEHCNAERCTTSKEPLPIKMENIEESDLTHEKIGQRLVKDIESASDSKLYLCRMCEEYIVGTDAYKDHIMAELQKSDQYLPTPCSFCKKRFTSKRSLLYHTKLFHCAHKLRCPFCRENFPSKLQLQQHKRSCPKLQKGTLRGPTLQKRAKQNQDKITHQKKSHSCVICEVDFDKYREKAKHMKLVHPEGASVPCIKCKKQYKTIKDLRYHKHIYHPKQRVIHRCETCTYTTPNKYALKQHVKKHSKEQITIGHTCEKCGLGYGSVQALRRHMQTHEVIKNHVCHICGKGFTQKCTLDRHLDSHGKIKRFKCAKCSPAYTQSYPLTKHVKTFHPEIFDQFQKERQTAKWKNLQPESTSVVAPSPRASVRGSKRNFITIVQVPKEGHDESGVQKYRYIFMNSTGKIVRPNESDLMGSLMTAFDITEEPTAPSKQRVIKAKAKVIKPVSRSRKKELSVVPATTKPLPDDLDNAILPADLTNETNPEVLTFQMPSQLEFDLAQSECLDMTLGFDTESNKFALFRDQNETTDTGFTLDTPLLNPETLDFGSLNDSLTEDQTFGFLQNVPEDYWYDFSQSDTNLLSGLSFLTTDNVLQASMEETNPQTTVLTQELGQEPVASTSTTSELLSSTSGELPTVEDVPTWATDQMVLVQDGENSYLISADDLAKFGNSQTENDIDPPNQAFEVQSSAVLFENITETSLLADWNMGKNPLVPQADLALQSYPSIDLQGQSNASVDIQLENNAPETLQLPDNASVDMQLQNNPGEDLQLENNPANVESLKMAFGDFQGETLRSLLSKK